MITDERWNEFLQLMEDEYRRLVGQGVLFTPAKERAKKAAYECYPDVQALMAQSMKKPGDGGDVLEARQRVASIAGFWKRLQGTGDSDNAPPALSLNIPPPPPPTMPAAPIQANGNSRSRKKPGIVLYESGYSNLSATMLSLIKALGVKAEDAVNFGDLRLWNEALGCSEYAIPNCLLDSGTNESMKRAGYQFRPSGRGYREYVVTCVTSPRSEIEIERENLKRQIAELRARLSGLEE